MKHETSCGAILFQKDDDGFQYLLIHMNHGHWSMPKGHMGPGETEHETAMREILEETGYIVKFVEGFRQVVSYFPHPNVFKDVIFFVASAIGGNPQVQIEEVSEMEWLPFSKARERLTFARDKELLEQADLFLKDHYHE